MKHLIQLWNEHSAVVQARGRAYQRQGRVRLLESAPTFVRATVRGTEVYAVALDFQRTKWTAHCACPAFDDRGQCKHVCAVILESTAPFDRNSTRAHAAGTGLFAPQMGAVATGKRGFGGGRDDEDAEYDDEDEDDEDEYEDGAHDEPRSGPRPSARRRSDEFLHSLHAHVNQILARKQGRGSEAFRAQELMHALRNISDREVRRRQRAVLRYILRPIDAAPGRVGIVIEQSKISSKGVPGAYRPLRRYPAEAELDELDRSCVDHLLAAGDDPVFLHSGYGRYGELWLRPILQRTLLARLARERRLFAAAAGRAPQQPLTFDEGAAWSFAIEVKVSAQGFDCVAFLMRDELRIPLEEVQCALAGGFAVSGERLLSCDWHGAVQWAARLCGERSLRVSRAEATDLTRLLEKAPIELPILAEGLVENVKGPPRPVLSLQAPHSANALYQGAISFDYQGVRLPRGGPAVRMKGDRVIRAQRSLECERAAEAAFEELGGRLRAHPGRVDGTFKRADLGSLVRGLVERGWLVEGEGMNLRNAGSITVGVRSGVDWFDVDVAASFGDGRMNVLEALLRLRQAACHLALVDPEHVETPSAKLTTLLTMLEELRSSGHKALVFSQFTTLLAHVKSALDAQSVNYAYLDGKTTARQAVVEEFQDDPATSVFLISLKAGGVGLNLTSADYVFLLDPWWNPAVERQAVDRTHRIGQTRPVTAYRLVARGTVEEKVLELQDKKRALAAALFEGGGSALGSLTRADLEGILS